MDLTLEFQELMAKYEAAHVKVGDLLEGRTKRERLAVQVIRAECAAGLEAAEKVRYELRVAVEAAKLAMNEAKPPLPLGTTVVKWRLHGPSGQPAPTGERGVIQVLHAGDPLPNRRQYGQPKVADVVVRLLLKSGEQGKTVVKYYEPSNGSGWHPAGVVPVHIEPADREAL